MQLKQLSMVLEVSYLFGDINRRRLLMDMKGKLDVLILDLLRLLLSLLLFYLELVGFDALWVLVLLLRRFVP